MISDNALKLIFTFEGVDQPSLWPGGNSGVTIGYGYDLGYEDGGAFTTDWSFLPADALDRLERCLGLRGEAAHQASRTLADIRIQQSDAQQVFINRSLPKYEALTVEVFPHADTLPPDAYGALVSLVYNRGASLVGDSRREMRVIREAVAHGDLRTIAAQIRSMKRLWEGKHLDGLIARREAEAQLVDSCIKP